MLIIDKLFFIDSERFNGVYGQQVMYKWYDNNVYK